MSQANFLIKTFWLAGRPHLPPPQKKEIPSLNETSSSPHKKNPVGEGRVLDLLTVMILKRVNESISFKSTNLQQVRLKIKKRWQIL